MVIIDRGSAVVLRLALHALCITALISKFYAAEAGPHLSCQDDKLNTYQHGDCEQGFADKAKQDLELTVKSLDKVAGLLVVGDDFKEASSAFEEFVEKECRFQGDATFGTMGTYVVEECRSTYFEARNNKMADLLREFKWDLNSQGRNRPP